ncbi:MAG: ArsR family transcriptional regulator [Dehalococcoidia bacterium]
MQATRQTILDVLRERRECGVQPLAALLSLTDTAVRQHLAALQRAGLVDSREVRRGVGRPALAYRLTAQGEDLYPKAYGELAAALLASARATLPPGARRAFTAAAAEAMAQPHLPALHGCSPHQRVEAACGLLREQAVAHHCEPDGEDGFVLVQETCPFGDMALEDTLVCEMETSFIARVSGMRAELAASRAAGDPCCVYRLRPTSSAQGPQL